VLVSGVARVRAATLPRTLYAPPPTPEKQTEGADAMHHVYLRVSTDHQDEENQKTGVIQWLVDHGNPPMMLHTDTASGATSWKNRKLAGLLEKCTDGDHIVAAEVSRLGRSTVDVLDFLRAALLRGVTVIITKSGLTVDHSLQSKITTTILALAAEIEREFLLARTQEGYRRARAAGVRVGRPPGKTSASKLDPKKSEIDKLRAAGVSVAAIGRLLDVSRATVQRYLDRRQPTEGDQTK